MKETSLYWKTIYTSIRGAKDYSADAPVKAYDFNLNMYATIKNTRVVTVVKPNQIKLTVEL